VPLGKDRSIKSGTIFCKPAEPFPIQSVQDDMIHAIENNINKLHEFTRKTYQKLPAWAKQTISILFLLAIVAFSALLIYTMSKTPFQLI